MVRRAEGAFDVDGRTIQQAGDRVDGDHLERLFLGERREYRWKPASEHRLARPGRTDEEDVVAARCRDLERALGTLLSGDVAEVGRCRRDRVAVDTLRGWKCSSLQPEIGRASCRERV